MVGVGVGVEVADGNGLHLRVATPPHHLLDVFHSQRLEHRAVLVHPLLHLEPEVAGHERARLLEPHVVEIGTIAPADLEHVPEPAGGDERRFHTLPLGDRVDDHGAAMDEVSKRVRREIRQRDRVEHPLRQVAGPGQRLGQAGGGRVLVEEDEIGERPADVGRDPEAHAAGRRRPRPPRCAAVRAWSMVRSSLRTTP